MLTKIDRIYYSRRIIDEMALGDLAAEASIAALHYEFAHRYALLADETRIGLLSLSPWKSLIEQSILFKAAQPRARPL